jgi:hypothetical protein
LEFVRKGGEAFNLKIPESIGRFKDITALHLVGCVKEIPNSICELKKLMFLSLPDNTNLEALPECIADLPNLTVLNLKNSNPDKVIPPRLREKLDDPNSSLHYFG